MIYTFALRNDIYLYTRQISCYRLPNKDKQLMSPYENFWFWLAIAGATAFKLLDIVYHGVRQGLAAAFGGIFAAVIFAPAILDYLNLTTQNWMMLVAGIMTLTGEHVIRLVIKISKDPKVGLDLWKAWRNKDDK